MDRCECSRETLCAFHEAQGASQEDAVLFAERRWQAQQEFH